MINLKKFLANKNLLTQESSFSVKINTKDLILCDLLLEVAGSFFLGNLFKPLLIQVLDPRATF